MIFNTNATCYCDVNHSNQNIARWSENSCGAKVQSAFGEQTTDSQMKYWSVYLRIYWHPYDSESSFAYHSNNHFIPKRFFKTKSFTLGTRDATPDNGTVGITGSFVSLLWVNPAIDSDVLARCTIRRLFQKTVLFNCRGFSMEGSFAPVLSNTS